MRDALKRIQNGEFARKWADECNSGGKDLKRLREEGAAHPVERAGVALRKMMLWLD